MTASRANRLVVCRSGLRGELRRAFAGISTLFYTAATVAVFVPTIAEAQLQLRRPTPVVTPSADTPPSDTLPVADPEKKAPDTDPRLPAPAGVTGRSGNYR